MAKFYDKDGNLVYDIPESLTQTSEIPQSSTDTGMAGEIRFGTDGSLYICVATNSWRRCFGGTW